MLELKDVTKIYYTKNKAVQTIALKNVNLTIGKGEFVAVTGDSGSGKTTLLNMLGAVDTPTSGRVLFQGKDLSLLSSDKRAEHRNKYTGFVFQRFYLDPNLTVSENVALPLTIQGVAAAAIAYALVMCFPAGLTLLLGKSLGKLMLKYAE